ncbi:MAG TPA: serpin family protein, partial [Nitrospira sp.]|nr:serpin family protein [Nitrospira sp.]
FAAGVWEADFRSNPDQAVSDINSWTSAQTDGRIPQLFPPGSLTSQTALVLADALYFKAAWQHPFLVAQTSLGIFHNAVGDPTTTPFMFSDSFNVPAARTRSYQAVELPYVGGRLTALVVMPTHSSLSSFVRTLDSTSLDLMIQGLHKTPVNLSLPRFRVDAPNDLSDALQAMGLSNAFHRATANFSGISSSAAYVQQVRQRTFLSVTELGTEAAAASGVSIISSARAGEIITVNRPFLFLIRDSDTGAILFASEIESLR